MKFALWCRGLACIGAAQVFHVCARSVAPEQLHLAFAGEGGDGTIGMRVAWFTWGLPTSPSSVQYGKSAGNLTLTTAGEAAPRRYLWLYGYHHVVKLDRLDPDTTYYYRVGGGKQDGVRWSREWSFRTPPTGAAAAKASFSYAIFGDMGWEDSERRPSIITAHGLKPRWSATYTRQRLEAIKGELDGVWHVGDIGYADDAFGHNPVGFVYEKAYNGFMNWMENLSATMPYMVSPGNHESECHGAWCMVGPVGTAEANFTAFNSRWHMPSGESGGHPGSAMWYSWNHGSVHFVSINTETDWDGAEETDTGDSHDKFLKAGHFGAPGEYMRWLEADLRAAAMAKADPTNVVRWIVAGGHRPYKSIKGKHTDLFAKYGVDMYFAGHTHSYSRSAPYNGTLYIVSGGAGCDEMAYPENVTSCAAGAPPVPAGQGDPCEHGYNAPAGTVMYTTARFTVGVLTASQESLRWKLLDSITGEVLDTVSVNDTAPNTNLAAVFV